MGFDSVWHWLLLIVLLTFYIPAWRIVSKAGFHGVLSLLLLVPLVNIVMLWVFAFVPWPVEQRKG
jgi:hypothetical protein